MMKQFIGVSYVILTVLIVIQLSCQKKVLCPDCTSNKNPIARAGTDQHITLPKDSTVLDGTGSSDADGSIVTFKWTKISGPASSTIITPNSPSTIVKSMAMGIYQFELTVTDNGGLSAKDTVHVTVDNPLINQPPVACAGADQTITLPVSSVTLNGTCSTDPDNNITSYTWTKISGPPYSNITNINAVSTQATTLQQGTYLFELRVTDNGALFSKDTVQINVLPMPAMVCDPVNRQTINLQLVPIATIPFPRMNMSVASAGNKLLLAGGSNGGSGVSDVSIYDFGTQSWSTANMSLGRTVMDAATVGDKVFFAGGKEPGFVGSRRVEIYDIPTNTFTVSLLPARAYDVSIAATGNIVFFASSRQPGGKVDVYDTNTSTWSELTLSDSRVVSTPTAVGNKIYFAGGGTPNGLSSVIDIYDNATGTWSKSSLSQPTAVLSGHYLNGKIYWAGGAVGYDFANDADILTCKVEIRDVITQNSTFTNLSTPMGFYPNFTKTISFNSKILFFNRPGHLEMYDPQASSWSIGKFPAGTYIESLVIMNNILYAVGCACGNSGNSLSNQIWKVEF